MCNVQSIAMANRPKPFLLSMSLSIKNSDVFFLCVVFASDVWVYIRLVNFFFLNWSPLRLQANGREKKKNYHDWWCVRRIMVENAFYAIQNAMEYTFFFVVVELFMQHPSCKVHWNGCHCTVMSTHNPNH